MLTTLATVERRWVGSRSHQGYDRTFQQTGYNERCDWWGGSSCASLPDSFNMLVTALEANEDVPKMDYCMPRGSRRKNRALTEKGQWQPSNSSEVKVHRQCHYCKKYGHIRKNCFERIKPEERARQGWSENVRGKKSKVNKVGLVACHVLGVKEPKHDWNVDSGVASSSDCKTCAPIFYVIPRCSLCQYLSHSQWAVWRPSSPVNASKGYPRWWSHLGSYWYRSCGSETKINVSRE